MGQRGLDFCSCFWIWWNGLIIYSIYRYIYIWYPPKISVFVLFPSTWCPILGRVSRCWGLVDSCFVFCRQTDYINLINVTNKCQFHRGCSNLWQTIAWGGELSAFTSQPLVSASIWGVGSNPVSCGVMFCLGYWKTMDNVCVYIRESSNKVLPIVF